MRRRRPLYLSLRPRFADGHEVELLENGAAYFPALEAAIRAAQRTVHLETYILADDPAGRRIAAALADAAARGVRVRVIVDGFGTPALEGEVARLLAHPGVRLQVFRPERWKWWPSRRRLRRLHRKMTVIDAQQVFVGGINLLDDFLDPNHGPLEAPRFDFAVRVRGPLVAQAHLAARRLWWELTIVNQRVGRRSPPTGRVPEEGRARLEPPSDIESIRPVVPDAGAALTEPARVLDGLRAALMVRDNFRHRRTIERWYTKSIGRARREVLIACAYFFPGIRLRRALIQAARRGVRVRLLLQGRVEYRLKHYATQAMYDHLLAGGIEIVEYTASFLHAKVAVIDDQVTVGSSNLDPFSLLLAREANVVVDDAKFAAMLRARLEAAMVAGGEPLALYRHRRRPWPVRAANWFSFVLLRAAVALSGRGAGY